MLPTWAELDTSILYSIFPFVHIPIRLVFLLALIVALVVFSAAWHGFVGLLFASSTITWGRKDHCLALWLLCFDDSIRCDSLRWRNELKKKKENRGELRWRRREETTFICIAWVFCYCEYRTALYCIDGVLAGWHGMANACRAKQNI